MKALAGDTFSVFNIGTGHHWREKDSTIAELYRQCDGDKHVNDGPLGMLRGLTGWGLNAKCRATVDRILEAGPSTVNLAGHSRGGVLCYMIANGLASSKAQAAREILEVNIVVLDPVHMSYYGSHATELQAHVPLKRHLAIVMENVSGAASKTFPLTEVESADETFEEKSAFITMPGTHGSGTQVETSAIGKACYALMQRCMHTWGTPFSAPLPSFRKISELFAQVLHENPAAYGRSGLVSSRPVSDYGAAKKDKAVGRQQQIDRMTAKQGSVDFRNSPYFLNEVHALAFKEAFPAIYAKFDGGTPNQARVDSELRDIEVTCPYIQESFQKLGMV